MVGFGKLVSLCAVGWAGSVFLCVGSPSRGALPETQACSIHPSPLLLTMGTTFITVTRPSHVIVLSH